MNNKFRKIAVIVFLIVLVIVAYVTTQRSYIEYQELGTNYISIFKTNMMYRYSIMAVNFVLTFCIMYFANRGIKKGLKVFFDEEKKEMPKLMNKSIALLIAVVSSIFIANVFTPKVILFASNVSFERTDMIFNLDISFYMFLEPLIKMILLYILWIFVFLIAYSAFYYIIVFNRFFDAVDRDTLKKSYLIKHIIRYVRYISIIFAIYTLVKTLDIVFSNFITTNSGVQLVGAGVVDITIRVVANILLGLVIVVSVFLATANIKKEQKTKVVKNILIVPAYLVIMFVVMIGFDLIFVKPNEYDKEKVYIERNIAYTRNAYGIDINNESIEYSGTITTDEINDNKDNIENAIIIDKETAVNTINGKNINSKVTVDSGSIIKKAKLALSEVIYDDEPYVVLTEDGNRFWVIDVYTVSSNYPYSTYTAVRYNGEKRDINYIRNSIKIIANCSDGSMKIYITDTSDPIAMAYRKMYPSIFESLDSKISEEISSKFVYPKFLYDIQSSMIEEYHNTKPEVLYRGDDSWKKATYVTTQNNKTVNTTLDSYYTMLKDGEIALVQMYNTSGKQNLTGYLVGTIQNGLNNLKIMSLESDESILGLTQLDSKISEDENMQEEIDKLKVTGAKITKDIMVVPVENTLLYIEQIYQTKTNETDSKPVLKKVIVASGNKMAIGNNLEDALENLVSQDATSIDITTTDDLDGIIESLIKANKNLSKSMDSKDWNLIGTDIKNLQDLINKLEEEKKKEKKENAQNITTDTNTISNSVNEIINIVQ